MTLGKHLIVEVFGEPESLPFRDMKAAADVLKRAAVVAGATVLSESWHHFGEGFGYTGVIALSESHISVHTWPESGYAAIDVFMCGNADPELTLPAIKSFYKANMIVEKIIERGNFPQANGWERIDASK